MYPCPPSRPAKIKQHDQYGPNTYSVSRTQPGTLSYRDAIMGVCSISVRPAVLRTALEGLSGSVLRTQVFVQRARQGIPTKEAQMHSTHPFGIQVPSLPLHIGQHMLHHVGAHTTTVDTRRTKGGMRAPEPFSPLSPLPSALPPSGNGEWARAHADSPHATVSAGWLQPRYSPKGLRTTCLRVK